MSGGSGRNTSPSILVRERHHFFLVALVNSRVQRHVNEAERELAAIERAFGGHARFFQFVENLGRDFLGRIAIVRGEAVQNFFVPDPVFEHLRRGFDEIARNARAGET